MLSLIVFLPLAGALLALLAGGRGDRPEREPLVRNVALAASLLTFAATLVLWWRFDPASADYQFVETHAWMPMFGIQYLDRCRRHQPVPGGADRLSDPAGAALVVGIGAQERQALLVLRARARDRHARRVRLDRPFPLLHLLGRDAHPDVFPHRDLGLRAPHLRRHQVHALHDGGQCPHAHRHHRSGVGLCRDERVAAPELQPARPLRLAALAADGELVLPGLCARLCHQGSALPVPHVAA